MIEARTVDFRRGDAWVLREVSLALHQGEITAICGPNGAGKSTLLGVLSGEFQPMHGTVQLDGKPLAAYSPAELACRRSVLEQAPRLDAPFAVHALVAFGLAAMPAIAPQQASEIIASAMADAGVEDFAQRPITQLSGGERHRAHLARVFAQIAGGQSLGHACTLLLDEPTASLDLAHQINVMQRLRLVAQARTGVAVVLHDLNLAAAFADRVVLMKAGRIVSAGPPHEILTTAALSEVYEAPLSVIAGAGRSLRIAPDLPRYGPGRNEVA